MKKLLIFLLIIEAGIFLTGLYLEWADNNSLADKFLGSFTLLLFLVIIPVFLYWRLKDKDLSSYGFKNKEFNKKNPDQ